MTKQEMQIIDDACFAAIANLAGGDEEAQIDYIIAQLGRGDLRDLKEALMDDWVRDQIRKRARGLGITLMDEGSAR